MQDIDILINNKDYKNIDLQNTLTESHCQQLCSEDKENPCKAYEFSENHQCLHFYNEIEVDHV